VPMVLKLGLWAGVFGLALRFAGCPVWLRILWTARLKASRLSFGGDLHFAEPMPVGLWEVAFFGTTRLSSDVSVCRG